MSPFKKIIFAISLELVCRTDWVRQTIINKMAKNAKKEEIVKI